MTYYKNTYCCDDLRDENERLRRDLDDADACRAGKHIKDKLHFLEINNKELARKVERMDLDKAAVEKLLKEATDLRTTIENLQRIMYDDVRTRTSLEAQVKEHRATNQAQLERIAALERTLVDATVEASEFRRANRILQDEFDAIKTALPTGRKFNFQP